MGLEPTDSSRVVHAYFLTDGRIYSDSVFGTPVENIIEPIIAFEHLDNPNSKFAKHS